MRNRLENVVKGFVDALTDRAAPPATTNRPPTNATAATASGSGSSATAIATTDAKSKSESGWDLIRKLVKLLRTKGNQYGYAVGVRYQEWCRWHGKRDTLKGLTRVVGVRPDAWATNAKHVLLSIRNGLDTFFEWLALQKDQNGKEQSANGLERSVRKACRDPRTVSDLWAIAVFSDGLFQPLMMAINDDTCKTMLHMRSVALAVRLQFMEWEHERGLDTLRFGLLLGDAPRVDDVICAGASYLERATLLELACVSRQTLWNMQKRVNTNTKELSRLAAHTHLTFQRFVVEYLPGGALHTPSSCHRRDCGRGADQQRCRRAAVRRVRPSEFQSRSEHDRTQQRRAHCVARESHN